MSGCPRVKLLLSLNVGHVRLSMVETEVGHLPIQGLVRYIRI